MTINKPWTVLPSKSARHNYEPWSIRDSKGHWIAVDFDEREVAEYVCRLVNSDENRYSPSLI